MNKKSEGRQEASKPEGTTSLSSENLWENKCIRKPLLMESGKIHQHLRNVRGWSVIHEGGHDVLGRVFEFDNFDEACRFQEAYSRIVEEQDHHPEGNVRVVQEGDGKARVPLHFRTHSAGGITLNDFIMAAKANHLLEDLDKKG